MVHKFSSCHIKKLWELNMPFGVNSVNTMQGILRAFFRNLQYVICENIANVCRNENH